MPREMKLRIGLKGLRPGTNILDVRVPAKLRERVPTGIAWVDASLGGKGLAPSSVNMLSAGPGLGKTTLCMQMADSLTEQGHACLFNTTEESLYQTSLTAERLGLKSGFACGQDVFVRDILRHADIVRRRAKHFVLFVDSLQSSDDGKYRGGTNGNTPVRVAEMLVDYAKKTDAIVLFIGQCTKGGDFAGKNIIKHAIDGHLHMHIDRQKRSPTYGERIFAAQKNRFGGVGAEVVVELTEKGVREKFFCLDEEDGEEEAA